MPDQHVSPISQLLHTLGITREDLSKHSDQMRQFLTADMISPSPQPGYRSRSNSDLCSAFRSSSASSSVPRSISRTNSASFRDSTPPITPIKLEAPENTFSSRQYDSMEMVIERQRRMNKKERKSRREKERATVPNPPSPSPSNASSQPSVSLDSFMQSRDGGRAQHQDFEDDVLLVTTPIQSTVPVTPQKNRYYREHTELNSASHSREHAGETPTNPRTRPTPNPQSASHYQYYPYSAYGTFPPPLTQNADASPSALPVTPQTNRTQNTTKIFKSPLPPSSPPPSSPISSPPRAVNLVSSPGPIGPPPKEEEYDKLPYTLPPGPYSTNKPDLSYAALVGQAILSSPEHRLTLQEIYDWITIVYPHFKRGETTWMNSIRHVLSTTVCFRKVPRDRSVGRTQWAIWDEDLECFKGGNFRKHLCKDYMKEVAAKEKLTKGKTRARKRTDIDDGDSRKSKRARKDQPSSPVLPPASNNQYPSASFAPLFPPTRPTPHHQPYYQSCMSQTPQTLPAEIIFPPLPAASAFNRVLHQRNEASAQSSAASSASSTRGTSPPQTAHSSSSSTPTSSASSVPGLTPNRHSSSSPSMPATSDMDMEGVSDVNAICSIVDSDSHRDEKEQTDSDNADTGPLSGSTMLKPVRFWGDQSKVNALEPGIDLLSSKRVISEDEDDILKSKADGQRNVPPLLVPPTSPTLERKAAKAVPPLLSAEAGPSNHPTTPTTPSTPPSRHLQISSVRTPLSHKGLHMSPTASLAHYKSHLDPPPTVSFEADGDHDPLRTPRRRKESNEGLAGNPLTPRKLFSSSIMDSPFRTPNGFGASPFSRTPQSKPVLDPQDPRTLLDDELHRMGTLSDSPGGLFGKSRSSLLYDSPGGLDLPGKYRSWW